jgi:DUF1365 family protein
MSASAVYEGWVGHRRLGPARHGFRYRVFMPLFDLGELPELLDPIPLWSARRPAPARFRCDDYLGGGSPPELAEGARDLVEERVGRRPTGPVRLLANPRYLGVGFNPVSFFFLYGEDGVAVEAVIAEVTNTPWGERTAYVLERRPRDPSRFLTGTFEKAMHVSPFQPMEQRYEISVGEPGEELRVGITNLEGGRSVHNATMTLKRRELSGGAMVGMVLRYPPMTLATLGRIYANALRLRLRGAPYHQHPRTEARRRSVAVKAAD